MCSSDLEGHVVDPGAERHIVDKLRRPIGSDRDQRAEQDLDPQPDEFPLRGGDQCQEPVDALRRFGNEESPRLVGECEGDRSSRSTSIDSERTECDHAARSHRLELSFRFTRAAGETQLRGGAVSTLQRLDLGAECTRCSVERRLRRDEIRRGATRRSIPLAYRSEVEEIGRAHV